MHYDTCYKKTKIVFKMKLSILVAHLPLHVDISNFISMVHFSVCTCLLKSFNYYEPHNEKTFFLLHS